MVALYANVGADLTHYDVDVAHATLTRRATVTLPAGVHRPPAPSTCIRTGRFLYGANRRAAQSSGGRERRRHDSDRRRRFWMGMVQL